MDWQGKPYYSLDSYLKKQFGMKLYKLSLSGNMSCPNRDGTLDVRGCIFCSRGGSGEFAASAALSVTEQIEAAKLLIRHKQSSGNYIAYFQAYTNTHAPVDYLRKLFTEAISHPDISVLSIATRPDCLPDMVLNLLSELNQIKPVWIELGLQTIHEKSAKFIRRGYTLAVFEKALADLKERSIPVIVHTILGLPCETREDMLRTIQYLADAGIQGIKLQLLHILRGTDLEQLYRTRPFPLFTLEEYVALVISCLERLPEDIVIHRLTGDGPRALLMAPLWSLDKRAVLNRIHREMKIQNTCQGRSLN